MAPRALWKGALTIGVLSVPVKLFTAQRSQDLRFRELHAPDLARVRHERICAVEGEPVPPDEIVKGYEVAPGKHVVVTEEELDTLRPERIKEIAIDRFVPADVDPLLFDRTYHLGPDTGGANAYGVFARALAAEGLAGLGSLVLRQRSSPVLVRPLGDGLVATTLHYADELVDASDLRDENGQVTISDKERKTAAMLIDALADDFDPTRHRDTYRERVLDLIQKKAAGEEIELPAPAEPAPTEDLLTALEASLAAARERAGERGAKPAAKASRRKTAKSA